MIVYSRYTCYGYDILLTINIDLNFYITITLLWHSLCVVFVLLLRTSSSNFLIYTQNKSFKLKFFVVAITSKIKDKKIFWEFFFSFATQGTIYTTRLIDNNAIKTLLLISHRAKNKSLPLFVYLFIQISKWKSFSEVLFSFQINYLKMLFQRHTQKHSKTIKWRGG